MKLKKAFISILTVMVCLSALIACDGGTNHGGNASGASDAQYSVIARSETTFGFVADEAVMQLNAQTKLADYMDALAAKGALSFVTENGAYGYFITSVNGRAASTGEFWAVYTSDADNSNSEWGTFDLSGTVYLSATSGISDLTVKLGEAYLLALSSY